MKHRQFARIGLLLLSTQLSVVAATYTVDTTTDDITATACNATVINDCSLSGAMSIVANGDTIDFDLLANSVITLQNDLPSIVDKNLTIEGSTISGVTISGDNTHHPFHINSDSNVTIQGLSIISGVGNNEGGAIFNEGNLTIIESTLSGNTDVEGKGGAIYNKSGATLKIVDSNITSNTTTEYYDESYGGAIYSKGKVTISGSRLVENSSQSNGGAIFIENSTLEISNSTISGNHANSRGGGGIFAKQTELNILNSTISDNSTIGSYSYGGAIESSYSNTTLKNCTISGNKATVAGAVYQEGGTLKITHSTITNNTQTSNSYDGSGGIYLYSGSSTTVKNSIITGNISPTAYKDCNIHYSSTLTSKGFNILESAGNCDFTETGDATGNAPDIGALSDNGGATKTHAIIPNTGNIAWNTGTCDDIANTPVLADQRGELRPGGLSTECDIGAFEFGLDSDIDGLDILTELAYGTNPTVADSDIDGLNDGDEVYQYKTDPTKFDTDGDGAGDGDEIAAGTDPLDPNSYPFVGISPIEFLFGTTSGVTYFSITNTTVNAVTLPSATLEGPGGANTPPPVGFSIASDACAGILPAGQSCTIQVAYPASSNESRSAFLQIADVNLTAFVHNYEGVREEAVRRLPAVIGSIDYDPEMTSGNTETIEWSFVGYDDHNYTSHIAFFDCSGVAAGECAKSYGSSQRFAQGLHLQPNNVGTTGWSYKGLEMKQYNYSFDLTPNHDMPIVMRFYYQSGLDIDLGLRSISTIIPGGFLFGEEPYDYYDTSGRKISAQVGYGGPQ